MLSRSAGIYNSGHEVLPKRVAAHAPALLVGIVIGLLLGLSEDLHPQRKVIA